MQSISLSGSNIKVSLSNEMMQRVIPLEEGMPVNEAGISAPHKKTDSPAHPNERIGSQVHHAIHGRAEIDDHGGGPLPRHPMQFTS